MDIGSTRKREERRRNFEAVEKGGWETRSENTGYKRGGLREEQEQAEEKIPRHMKGRERDTSSFSDERQRGVKERHAGDGKPKGELDIYIGILGFALRRTLSRGESRARDRVEYEKGGHVD